MMLSLLAILFISNVNSQVDKVCITGRIEDTNFNIGVNGLYSYDTDYNLKSSYVKENDCTSASTLYLYWSGNQWRIGEQRANNVGPLAYCTQTDITSCTAGNWVIYETSDTYENDNAMYAQADECPTWPCASVTSTVTTGSANCQSFDTQVGPNAYKNDDNYYWYYNPVFQNWRCINGNNYDYASCSAQYNAATSPGWTQQTSGNSITMTYEFASPAGDYDVTCTGTGSNFPSPTKDPTDPTPQPTTPPTATVNNIPSDEAYCIYGGTSDTNAAINGYWEPTGRFVNSVQSYSKTIYGDASECPGVATTLYLYVLNTQWYISTEEESTAFFARCGRDVSVTYPACDSSGWYVWESSGLTQDTAVRITTKDNCPTSSCQSITTSLGNGCGGPFTPLADPPNAYINSGGNRYFYYIPFADSWVCHTNLDSINTCPYTYTAGPVSGFNIACTGSTADDNNTPAPVVTSDATDAPSKGPSRKPTRPPTTDDPTKAPSVAAAFCVSGASGTNAQINGYYKSTGEKVSLTLIYEKIVVGSTCSTSLYLYRVNDYWYISATSQDTSSYLARCQRLSTSLVPVCRADWETKSSGTDSSIVLAESSTCTSTCTGTGTNSPTSPTTASNNNNNSGNNNANNSNNNNANTRAPTRSPQSSSNNSNNNSNNDNNSNNNSNNSGNNNTPAPNQSSGTTQDNSSDANILCKFYVIAFSLLFGLIL